MALSAAKLLQVDRLCRSITQAVKEYIISVRHGLYPSLSAMKSPKLFLADVRR
jgi:ketopantoate hydroxymethyltransferase